MSPSNLAILLGPSVLRPRTTQTLAFSLDMNRNVMTQCIDFYEEIFTLPSVPVVPKLDELPAKGMKDILEIVR
jgi:hypothetical protein